MGKLIVVAFVFALLLVTPSPAHAEGQGQPDPSSQGTPTAYEYVSQRNNNLTLLVRRSLQLYDEGNDQISLSEAQIIYAETNIVQQLGSFQLDIGQAVGVPAELVAQYAQSSQSLSQAQLNAWTRYAARADFTLPDIEPTNAGELQATAVQDRANQTAEQAQNQESGDKTGSDSGADWWWFGLLAVVLTGAWYIFRGPDQKS